MKVSQEAIERYGSSVVDSGAFDVDAYALLLNFDVPEGGRVLCVGCHDEATANILADSGFKVTGVDLREYDKRLPPCNYEYIRRDFCEMDMCDFYEQFDAFVSLSAIEHFGFNTYEEGNPHRYYDVIAMRKAWEFLKEGGIAYITVPFGKRYVEKPPHWRVYDEQSLFERLAQDFAVLGAVFFCSAPVEVGGELKSTANALSIEQAREYDNVDVPHVTVLLVLKKVPVKRLAPDDT